MEGKEVAFFGKIAAGVTHELKNVLAIINESNGLMSDLLTLAKDAPFPHRERLLRSIAKISDQVRRGVEITNRFNQFAHSMDYPVISIDLNEVVTRTVALAERFARLKNVDLRPVVATRPIMLQTSPFRLQMALTRAIEACMEAVSAKAAIEIRVLDGEERPCLEITCRCESGDDPNLKDTVGELGPWREFQEVASILAISIQWLRGPGGGFSLTFGAAAPESKEQSTSSHV